LDLHHVGESDIEDHGGAQRSIEGAFLDGGEIHIRLLIVFSKGNSFEFYIVRASIFVLGVELLIDLVGLRMRLLITIPVDFDVSFQCVDMIRVLDQLDIAVQKVDFAYDEGKVCVDILFGVATLIEEEVFEEREDDFLVVVEVNLANEGRHLLLS
jgi:hypothetical protein